ncbi:MAG: ubiquitin-like small modifier protein 1 [Halobacteriales archaeon]|nr:ubiquitin-like small modifier protein 1 [Halobacteriales archaeon]
MNVQLRLFATFREAVGERSVDRDFPEDSTVGDVLHTLDEEYPAFEVFDEDGTLREYLSILVNGRDITHLDGVDTPLEDGDKLSLFPPVAGG